MIVCVAMGNVHYINKDKCVLGKWYFMDIVDYRQEKPAGIVRTGREEAEILQEIKGTLSSYLLKLRVSVITY